MATQGTVVGAEKQLEAKQLFQSIAALELYRAQIEVAKYLELAYLGVCNHPDVAKEVRLTAHSARTQHMMTTGLMKSFAMTAKHIVATMIPMIVDAVELEDKDLVMDCFTQIITRAEEMKQEAIDTRQQYYVIQSMIQNNQAMVQKKHKFVGDEQKRIEIEKEAAKKLAEEAERAERELSREKEKLDEDLTQMKKYRDKWMDKAETAGKEAEEENEKTFLDAVIVPPDMAAGPVGIVKSVMQTSVNIISSVFGRNKKEKQFKNMMQAFKDSQDKVDKMSADNREVLSKMQEQRKDRLERLATIKKLNIQNATLGDAQSLVEASVRLGDVDKQFSRIITFWDNMVVTLKFLKDDTRAGEVYLKKLENPKYAERFLASIGRAEHGWKGFGKICADYVQACETDENVAIKVLYGFLSAAIDQAPEDVRQTRMRAIEDDIEANIGDDHEHAE